MADSRHRNVTPRKRWSLAQSILPVAGLATVVAAGAAVVTFEDASRVETVASTSVAAPQKLLAAAMTQKPATVSRSAERAPLPNEAAADGLIEGKRFALTKLKVHAAAKSGSPVLATVAAGDKVAITGETSGGWAQIIHKDLPRWVSAKKIAKKMPATQEPAASKTPGNAPCASGSAVESGLQPDTVKVHRAVCALFPSISRYGGVGGGGEHASGRALDIMVSSDLGTQIAEYARANAGALGVSQVIWRQRIWTVQRAGNGWRPMSSRGGATANHMDHVHVTTYGNAAR